MILYAKCGACGEKITDKTVLKLLEVYPVKCPICGDMIRPLKAAPDETIEGDSGNDEIMLVEEYTGEDAEKIRAQIDTRYGHMTRDEATARMIDKQLRTMGNNP